MSASINQERPRNHLKEVTKNKIAKVFQPVDINKVLAEKYYVRTQDYIKELWGKNK